MHYLQVSFLNTLPSLHMAVKQVTLSLLKNLLFLVIYYSNINHVFCTIAESAMFGSPFIVLQNQDLVPSGLLNLQNTWQKGDFCWPGNRENYYYNKKQIIQNHTQYFVDPNIKSIFHEGGESNHSYYIRFMCFNYHFVRVNCGKAQQVVYDRTITFICCDTARDALTRKTNMFLNFRVIFNGFQIEWAYTRWHRILTSQRYFFLTVIKICVYSRYWNVESPFQYWK